MPAHVIVMPAHTAETYIRALPFASQRGQIQAPANTSGHRAIGTVSFFDDGDGQRRGIASMISACRDDTYIAHDDGDGQRRGIASMISACRGDTYIARDDGDGQRRGIASRPASSTSAFGIGAFDTGDW
jgi:hypothetical protein